MKKSLVLVVLLAAGCATTTSKEEGHYTFRHEYDEDVYTRIIEDNTQSLKSYDGLVNTFQMDATLINSAVSEAQLWRNATDFKWPRERFLRERESIQNDSRRETQVFLNFFTPENENDNLNTASTVWKIYLETQGKRFQASSINKASGTLTERRRLFPHHTRFNTGYIVTFKVPAIEVQQKPSKFILTGPGGEGEVIFQSLSNE